jgi:hypothetical protein
MVRGSCVVDLPQATLAETNPQALTNSAPLKLAARKAKERQHSTHKNTNGGAAFAVTAVSSQSRCR